MTYERDGPVAEEAARLCLSLTREGLTAYGNREALTSLRDELNRIIVSDPAEHFECHVLMTLENDASRFDGAPPNVWTLVSEEFATKVVASGDDHPGFELTLMLVEESDLDNFETHRETGIMP